MHRMAVRHYPALLRLVASGAVLPDRLIKRRIALTDAAGALAAMGPGRVEASLSSTTSESRTQLAPEAHEVPLQRQQRSSEQTPGLDEAQQRQLISRRLPHRKSGAAAVAAGSADYRRSSAAGVYSSAHDALAPRAKAAALRCLLRGTRSAQSHGRR